MKIFISWSGERSRHVAELLVDWLQCVIQVVEPWVSTRDIEGGAQWFSEITGAISNTSMGIFCLTQENKEKPWILFEAGAIGKGISTARVYTFLIDLETKDIKDPLYQFNHTLPNQQSVKKLIKDINSNLTIGKLSDVTLTAVFDTYWPQFNDKFQAILEKTLVNEQPTERDETDIMVEVLNTVRSLDKRLRSVENRPATNIHSENSIDASSWRILRETIKESGLISTEEMSLLLFEKLIELYPTAKSTELKNAINRLMLPDIYPDSFRR